MADSAPALVLIPLLGTPEALSLGNDKTRFSLETLRVLVDADSIDLTDCPDNPDLILVAGERAMQEHSGDNLNALASFIADMDMFGPVVIVDRKLI